MALDTRALVREASNLAPLPRAVTRLVSILSREDWTAEEVLEVVRLDPVLTGKLLGAANSATSGSRTKILHIDEAVRRIGPRAVVGLAIADGAKGPMSQALPQFNLGEGELWRHSVAALLAAEAASSHFRTPISTAAVTASLLHDVGKVLMARYLDPDTNDYLRLARMEGGHSVQAAEMEVLSISHAELGSLVAAHWGMPEEIVRAIQYHHDIGSAPEGHRRDAALVQLADSAAKAIAPPRIPDETDLDELALALESLDLQPEDLDGFHQAADSLYQRIGAAY